MKIGVLKETKSGEKRVALTPAGVKALVKDGHEVFVQLYAGLGSGFSADEYMNAGANVLLSTQAVLDSSELILKVKEPLIEECRMFDSHHTLFTYMHLATIPEQVEILQASGCTVIAYEMVKNDQGKYPLLIPMSIIAGRLATQIGAHYLQSNNGGPGILMGVGGGYLKPAQVTIVGGGVVGTAAAKVAKGMGADVIVLDSSTERVKQLCCIEGIPAVESTQDNLNYAIKTADLVVGSVLIPGKLAPKIVTEEMIKSMRPGSVVVDVAIDQGGCFETSRPTSHESPTYAVHGVTHYCVPNMPAAVAKTATEALTGVTLPYIKAIARNNWESVESGVCIRAGNLL